MSDKERISEEELKREVKQETKQDSKNHVGEINPEDLIKKLAETAEVIETMNAKLESASNQYARLQADFDNYRRRTKEEQARLSKTVTASIIKKFLPVLDNLDRALAHMSKDENAGPYLEGFQLMEKVFNKVMQEFGLVEIDAQGKPFDPYYHEALMEIQSDDVEEDTVAAVLQKGYMIGEEVLRPSKVQVAHK
ncbi:nucleotide exchange factor GrpE [Dialister pneumosintes]|jgi:Molecular chaperone GrpE (heat shock protein)|uniref:Protein GrpE n=1 Tax=Dialister pneumosintes TaxID=39950 RepID=A0A1B3WE64_9FIRM|nr:nucleotide exchange factor GrpE [Dialister pneumosintes]AOH39239.1 nucleotide exchange factor GrpE [Dialister pneumosintes]RID94867.1 nucleotide exchange factor GrpE [Dialister pneumosintes]CDF27046.1 protein GrpE [Dialister sp. CAG:588]